jgi:hypothetical protein
MPAELESLIFFIPFLYLGLCYLAYVYTRKRFP